MKFFIEVHKIISQMLGIGNMFGYKSTSANQLYLLYYFAGSFYYIDKIHWQIRFVGVSLHLCGIFVGCMLGTWHLLNNTNSQPWFHLYVLNFVGTPVLLGIFCPVAIHRYKASIETAIRDIDIILTATRHEYNSLNKPGWKFMNIRKVVLINLVGISTFAIVTITVCVIDVIFFYEDYKARDILYYTIPIPKTEQYGRLEFYLIANTIGSMVIGFIGLQWLSLVFLTVLWYAICHNQVFLLNHRIRTRSAELNVYADDQHEMIDSWNRAFDDVLVDASNRFQQIIRTKNKFDEFIGIICTILLPLSFCIGLAELYLTLSVLDMSLSLQIKEASFFMGLGWTTYIISWIADQVESSISQVSFEVYSLPWDRSKKVRKHVHLTLCQTQQIRNASIMGIWPLNLKSFAIYVNGLISYVNVLRRITNKSN